MCGITVMCINAAVEHVRPQDGASVGMPGWKNKRNNREKFSLISSSSSVSVPQRRLRRNFQLSAGTPESEIPSISSAKKSSETPPPPLHFLSWALCSNCRCPPSLQRKRENLRLSSRAPCCHGCRPCRSNAGVAGRNTTAVYSPLLQAKT